MKCGEIKGGLIADRKDRSVKATERERETEKRGKIEE